MSRSCCFESVRSKRHKLAVQFFPVKFAVYKAVVAFLAEIERLKAAAVGYVFSDEFRFVYMPERPIVEPDPRKGVGVYPQVVAVCFEVGMKAQNVYFGGIRVREVEGERARSGCGPN